MASVPTPRLPVEQALPGCWERLDGSLYVSHEVLDAAHTHGTTSLATLAAATPELLALLGGNEEVGGASVADLLFLDIETTGLGGAGAIAFLVTTAHLAADGLHVQQYLAGSPADEAALLTRLVADIRASHGEPVLVTYNGRTFDAPILDQRATMHRLRGTFEAMPHIDLLAPVRRGFRGLLPSCRLAAIEERFLGVTRPAHEVAGADVPTWYFRFLRTQDARHLIPLVTHNADDVLSLVALLARFAAIEAGTSASGLEHLALGRLHAGAGGLDAAHRHLEAARARLAPSIARDECLFALATLHRRGGRGNLAVPHWQEIAARPGALSARALVELAKHLEHRERDPGAALAHVERAIEAAGPTPALLRRRDRLARKTNAAAAVR
ncbi:MAG: ribonuclease H-like domain-containing protein [Dehalococcoidia bacterium]